jgi:hypothetical protein
MMHRRGLYEEIDREFRRIADGHRLWDGKVVCELLVRGFSRKPPRRARGVERYVKIPSEEYALTKGREVLLRARFGGSYGDAFTDEPTVFRGELSDLRGAIFAGKPERAVYLATLNAVFSSLGLIEGGVHCRGGDPERCGARLVDYILENFGRDVVVAHIGYQPGHVRACSRWFRGHVTDLSPENIGKVRFGRRIGSGEENEEVIRRSDVACITGSTLVNGSLPELLGWCERYGTEPIVYGVTASSAARILKLRYFCPYARRRP